MMKIEETKQIAEDAYIFGYPLILMEVTRRRSTAVNRFGHFTKLPNARFNAVASMSVLIKTKEFSGRMQDASDIKMLKKVRKYLEEVK